MRVLAVINWAPMNNEGEAVLSHKLIIGPCSSFCPEGQELAAQALCRKLQSRALLDRDVFPELC